VTCRRVWEAEAIEDGRLDASSVESFERHATACADCAKAVERLTRLRDGRLFLEPRRLTPFEHRRKRAELLRRANSEALRPPRRTTFFVLIFAAAALAATFVVFRVGRQAKAPAPSAARAPVLEPKFELRPIGDAEWHDATRGAAGRVVLAAGTLGVHVEHLASGQRFVVALPDGELEVHGTRFIVEVREGRTERVLVTEGVVSLRLNGGPERLLKAGESYVTGAATTPAFSGRPEALAPSSTIAPAGSHGAPPVQGTDSTSSVVVSRSGRALHAVTGSAGAAAAENRARDSRAAGVPAPGSAPDDKAPRATTTSAPDDKAPRATTASAPGEAAGDAFHAAMAAFSLGSYAEADERFAEFVARFPEDSRDEDAAFLRTVIAIRRGDPSAAVARARAYLRRFPDGLRRREMERMLETATAPEPKTP